MSAQTGIEWTDATWNPVGGCTIHSPGCARCYAMKLAARHPAHPVYAGTVEPSKAGPAWTGRLTVAPEDHPVWRFPLAWRGAKHPVMGEGKPSLIFAGDMSDLFHQNRSWSDIDRVMTAVARARRARTHIVQLLTKRPDVMCRYIHDLLIRTAAPPSNWAENLWLGASVERQQEAWMRRDYLKALADLGFTTFVSYEPALGPVDWTGWEFVKQIIAGGESGPRARPAHPDWFRATRDFCKANGIAFFFKQWGEFAPVYDRDLEDPDWQRCDVAARETPDGQWLNLAGGMGFHGERVVRVDRLGKQAAGRLLDGVAHSEFPNLEPMEKAKCA